MKKYQIVVLGGGPGGYVAAIKAAQLGAKVAVIEKEKLGGVCLNWGCIPTKTLLRTARLYEDILRSHEFGIVGIDREKVKIDWKLLSKRKDRVVNKLVSGIYMLFRKNKIDLFEGKGRVINKNLLEVNGEKIRTDNLIIGTGAEDYLPNISGLDEALKSGRIINSKGALQLEEVPKDLVIIGGGVIAVEFATLFNSLGSKVVLIQRSENILSSTEKEMAVGLQKQLIKDGINIVTKTRLKSIGEEGVRIEHEGREKVFKGDKYLISLGLKVRLEGIENLKLELDSKGFVKTNNRLETNVRGVYAIGDINGRFALAHVASAEGIVAVENIMGKDSSMNYDLIATAIYTSPELASIGLSEEEARGRNITVGRFPLVGNGKALAEGDTRGFVKIISDNDYGEIIGVHIMASNATDMISEAIVAMQLESTVYDVAKAIHPHPTLSEAVMEAAFASIDKPIHI